MVRVYSTFSHMKTVTSSLKWGENIFYNQYELCIHLSLEMSMWWIDRSGKKAFPRKHSSRNALKVLILPFSLWLYFKWYLTTFNYNFTEKMTSPRVLSRELSNYEDKDTVRHLATFNYFGRCFYITSNIISSIIYSRSRSRVDYTYLPLIFPVELGCFPLSSS